MQNFKKMYACKAAGGAKLAHLPQPETGPLLETSYYISLSLSLAISNFKS